jgi:hypothetical protein
MGEVGIEEKEEIEKLGLTSSRIKLFLSFSKSNPRLYLVNPP